MVINKSAFLVLIFSLLLSFGLLCSAACNPHGRKSSEHDPQQKYEKCQRRCEWETRGGREQEKCERQCEKKFKEEQEEGGRRCDGLNPEDIPQRRFEECQQRCEQQPQREQPECQSRCQKQYQEQQRHQKQCQEHCERQEQGPQEQQRCQRKCQQQWEEQPSHEREEKAQRQFEECQERCQEQRQGQREQLQCQQRCREQLERQEREGDVEDNHHHDKRSHSRSEEEEEEEEKGQERNNPYYFPFRRSFQPIASEEEGKFGVLKRFAEKSRLLQGINDYRLAVIEANPHTFVLPHHTDSEAIFFVTNGKGTITFVTHENKESYNVEPGTVVRAPAGATVYMVNQDNREKLMIAVLALSVNNPGKFQGFFPAGTGKPSSYFGVFNPEVIEAAFNTPRETLEKVFGGQRGQQPRRKQQQGVFRQATQEQIRALSQQATSPRERGAERFAINLLRQSPVYNNQNGAFFEVTPKQFKQLESVSVAACRINQGSIFVPHYNSRATFVLVVTEGNGYVQMACPHLSKQSQSRREREEREEEEEEEERSAGEYQKVEARLSPGDVFVVPAGHPVTFVSSENERLTLIGFGINGEDNKRIFVAGKKNMMRQMDSEAKEISFGVPARLIDEVFNKPEESYFMPFPQRRQRGEEGRGNPLSSILDFARLF